MSETLGVEDFGLNPVSCAAAAGVLVVGERLRGGCGAYEVVDYVTVGKICFEVGLRRGG